MFFLTACKKDKVPEGIIPQDKMQWLLMDIHYNDAFYNRKLQTDSTLSRASAVYQFIFKKYKTDSTQFKKSFDYYLQHPDILDGMYESMIDSVTKRQTQLSKLDLLRRNEQIKKDSLKNKIITDSLKNKIKKDSLKNKIKADSIKKHSLMGSKRMQEKLLRIRDSVKKAALRKIN